jgi:hypothetical protein
MEFSAIASQEKRLTAVSLILSSVLSLSFLASPSYLLGIASA